jgi:N-acetylglucosaminyldiphosphoundecaprenol N-acetyl-beta-D-mannosaminyltransferase
MNRVCLGQVELDPVTMDETVDRITTMMGDSRSNSVHVVTLNAQFVQIARNNSEFASLVRGADLCVADGVSLVWACRFLGQPLPGRVNGTDLMVRLCEVAARDGYTVYFLGGRPGAGEGAVRKLREENANLQVVGIDCPPMGFMDNPKLAAEVCERIQLAAPDFLFVGLGAPKQEYWIHNNSGLSAKVMVGVGGSFELIAGMTKRAPLLMQKTGLEWFWRLVMEPRRLWKRYLVGNSVFVLVVLQQWVSQMFASRTTEAATAEAERRSK